MSISNPPILTFHGPDGSGKTTIAEHAHASATNAGSDALLIGSSDFMSWLTPGIYRKFIGSTDRLDAGTEQNASTEAKTRLYEDIAVCLYGVAAQHSQSRGEVFIHSDPYLKRLVWEHKHTDPESFWRYASRFEDYVGSLIGDTFATHVAVIDVDVDECFRRINVRGQNGEYDPATSEDNAVLVSSVDFVAQTFLGEYRPYPRLQACEVVHATNPTSCPGAISQEARKTGEAIMLQVQDSKQ